MHPSTWWASDAKVRCSNSLAVGRRPRPEQWSNMVESNICFSLVRNEAISLLLAGKLQKLHAWELSVSFHGSPREIHLERISFPNRRLVQSRKRHKGETVLARGVSKRSSSSPFRGSVSTPLWIRSKYLPDSVNTLASSWQWARQVQCILKIKIKNDQNICINSKPGS